MATNNLDFIRTKYPSKSIDTNKFQKVKFNNNSYKNSIPVNSTNETLIYCNAHNIVCNCYCCKCELFLCKQCNINLHQSHESITLFDVKPITLLTNKINEGYNHINLYCNQLKNNRINYYISQINQLEYSYQSFKQKNYSILAQLKLVINHNRYQNDYLVFNSNEINLSKCINDNDKDEIIQYYKNYKILEESIDINHIKKIKTISQHNNSVNSLLLLRDGRLVSCSSDNTIKIYDMNNNYHCDITIEGHKDSLFYISQLDNNKLISCSTDKSLKIWSINKYSFHCDYTIKDAHCDWINKIIPLSNNRMASCSSDKMIKIWNSNFPYNLIKTLEGHNDTINSIIQIKGKEILISCGSGVKNSLHKWNLSTYECNKRIKNVNCWDSNSLLQIDDDRTIVGYDKTIMVININNEIIENKIENMQLGWVYSFSILRNGNILCGCDQGRICIYDIKLNTIIYKKQKVHDKDVTCIINYNKYQFVSCSVDKTITIWNY